MARRQRQRVLWSESLQREVQVLSDGRTCWVNDSAGGCIGRWSPTGVDVHVTAEEQIASGKQCLDCVPRGSWQQFQAAMKKHYDVVLPSTLIDTRYRGAA